MAEPTPQTSPSITIPPQITPSVLPTGDEKATHEHFMREALAMAQSALSTSETPVGCVFVHHPTSQIIGRGMNATNRTLNGTMHAELVGIAEILASYAVDVPARDGDGEMGTAGEMGKARGEKRYSAAILKECDLYVTIEPCIMCASLLRQYGIRKVYFGARNEKFGGTGGVLSVHDGRGAGWDGVMKSRGMGEGEEEEVEGVEEEWGMPEKGYEVSGGWLREEAILLLRRFYVGQNEKAPEAKSKKDRKLKTEVEPLVDLE